MIIILFLGWEVFIEIIISSIPSNPQWIYFLRGFPMVVKISLLLLWGMFSFLISYTYLDAKFLGIFTRIDRIFQQMILNENMTLQFRKGDEFDFMAESFNKMRQGFIEKIRKRKETLKKLDAQVKNLPENPSELQINGIIKEIDQELTR